MPIRKLKYCRLGFKLKVPLAHGCYRWQTVPENEHDMHSKTSYRIIDQFITIILYNLFVGLQCKCVENTIACTMVITYAYLECIYYICANILNKIFVNNHLLITKLKYNIININCISKIKRVLLSALKILIALDQLQK